VLQHRAGLAVLRAPDAKPCFASGAGARPAGAAISAGTPITLSARTSSAFIHEYSSATEPAASTGAVTL